MYASWHMRLAQLDSATSNMPSGARRQGRSRDDLICRSLTIQKWQGREVKRGTNAVTGYRLDLQGS